MRERELTRRIREFFRLGSGDVQTQVGGSAYNPAAVAITGGVFMGATLVGGPAQIASKSGISFSPAPTGSMGNNGAVTLGTALDVVYPNIYLFFPAGAVAAGVPAAPAWLLTQMSSTTVGTVFNNTYTTGAPVVPASPTAFVTTGPGAFTGVTTEIAGPNFPLAGGVMGANGKLKFNGHAAYTNSANGKILRYYLNGVGTTQFMNNTATTSTFSIYDAAIENAGTAATQTSRVFVINSGSLVAQVAENTMGTINTASAITPTISMTRNTATEIFVLHGYEFLLLADGT